MNYKHIPDENQCRPMPKNKFLAENLYPSESNVGVKKSLFVTMLSFEEFVKLKTTNSVELTEQSQLFTFSKELILLSQFHTVRFMSLISRIPYKLNIDYSSFPHIF